MRRPTLIIGTEPRVIVTVARSLSSHGVPVHAGTFAPDRVRIRSSAIAKLVDLAPVDAPEEILVNSFRTLITEHGYDTIIPCSDTALSVLMRIYNQVLPLAHVTCPAPEILGRVLDKQATLDAALRCGVPVPTQWKINSSHELTQRSSSIRFPLVAKPADKHSEAAFKVRYFASISELQSAYREDATFGTKYLLQQYSPGTGVGIEVLLSRGLPIAIFQHRRLTEFPASGGVSVTAIAEPLSEQLSSYALALLSELQWTGIAMVEFRHDKASNATTLMEVNGRYWGSLALSRHAGLEFPWYEWQLHHGERPTPPARYQTDARFHWLVGDLRRATDPRGSVPANGGLLAVCRILVSAFSLGRESVDALWSWRDPGPALSELTHFFRDSTIRALRRLARLLLPHKVWAYLARMRARRIERKQARKRGLRETISGEQISRARHILFVCHGNIMRSAFAEALLKNLLCRHGGFEVESAGVAARPGQPADPRVVSFASGLGIEMGRHRSRSMDELAVKRLDLVFVMDYANAIRVLTDRADLKDRVVLLSAVERDDGRAAVPIDDPYRKDQRGAEDLLRRVEINVRRLAELLTRGVGENR